MFRKRKPPVGSRPGTFVVNHQSPPPKIHVISYTADNVQEYDVSDAGELENISRDDAVNWIDVQGLGNEAVLLRIAEIFSLHPLSIADVVNVPQRPKAETYDEYLFLVTRTAAIQAEADLNIEQVSIFLGVNYVVSFQERYGDILDLLRARIRAGKGLIRRQGPDYLAYAILDTVIDGFFPVLESLGDYLEDLEDAAFEAGSNVVLRKINQARRTLLNMRRIVWPQREAVYSLIRGDSPMIGDTVRIYLRDCYDHCMQVSDVIDTYREVVGSLTNTYLSSVSNRINDVMKILTIMASIFIPLTFIVGIYGMNFQYMPELHARYAYPLVWLIIIAVAAGMILYFRRKGWIGSGSNDEDDEG
jgi:magnesium transporter